MAENCGHNFCHACITNVIADHAGWNCPECRSFHVKQADQLPRNRFVERAVESFNASSDQTETNNRCSYHQLEFSLCK